MTDLLARARADALAWLCPVRHADPFMLNAIEAYVAQLERDGVSVHYPPRDAPQDCPTGKAICETHRAVMVAADAVHVFWDVESKGSHFDLGMAYALGKPVVPVRCLREDTPGKSYWKVMQP